MAHKMDLFEQAEILDLYDQYTGKGVYGGKSPAEAYSAIAVDTHREQETVRKFIRSMRDTTTLATRMVRARAGSMMEKVIRKADPELLVDILQRPNIGVLRPVIKEPAAQIGIFVSTSRDSLGAVGTSSSDPLHYIDAETVDSERKLIEGEVDGAHIHTAEPSKPPSQVVSCVPDGLR